MSEFLNESSEILKHGSTLPHWQQGEVMQFVTFRLGDAMPKTKLLKWSQEHIAWLTHNPKPWTSKQEREYHQQFTSKLEEWLDQGSGSCLLKDPKIRESIEDILMKFQNDQVEHHAWVIMPNHLHLLFKPMMPLPSLIKAWKGASSRKIGEGSIWQKNYRDTLIRDSEHFVNAVHYIRRNPTKLPLGTFTLWQSQRALAIP